MNKTTPAAPEGQATPTLCPHDGKPCIIEIAFAGGKGSESRCDCAFDPLFDDYVGNISCADYRQHELSQSASSGVCRARHNRASTRAKRVICDPTIGLITVDSSGGRS